MAGIEDFVVQQIMNDFAQTPQAPQAQQVPSAIAPTMSGSGAPGSSFLNDAQYAGNFKQTGLPAGGVNAPGSPAGFTIADPAAREQYAQYAGRQAASAAGGEAMDRGLQERDAQKFKLLEGIKSLDPQIQGIILKRLGIDPGQVMSQLQQQKQLLAYKQQLEEPQNQTANAIKMLLATQGGQQHAAELAQKTAANEAEQQSRGATQNIQLMRVLSSLMQSDTNGKLTQTLGPLLMQMLQGAGVNLAPTQKAPAAPSSDIKITRRQ